MSLFGKNQKQPIDCQEAYNLWDALKSRYDAILLVQIYDNFVHDIDFKMLISHVVMKLMDRQAKKLGKQMDTFQLMLPERPPKSVRTPSNTEVFDDRNIASRLLSIMQEDITQQLRFIKTSMTNDDVRDMFISFIKEEISVYDSAVKHVKLKGWMGLPPMYKQIPEDSTEVLNAGEAFHLIDHLTARYEAIEKTQLFQNFAHDIDFKATLVIGLQKTLEKQVNILEQELNRFGIPLPPQPPKSVNATEGKDLFQDKKMFRDVFLGMRFMLELHATALRQCTTNDRLRKIFIQLLHDELSILDIWIKYGKIKGWLWPVPMYKV